MSWKRTSRKVWQLPNGSIPGLSAAAQYGHAGIRCQDRSIKRLLTVQRPPSKWTPQDVNELIYLANTCSSLLRQWPEYSTTARLAIGNEMVAVLAEVKRRKQQHGRYGVTGDEWQALRRSVTELQTWIAESVPAQRLMMAELDVDYCAAREDRRREMEGRACTSSHIAQAAAA
ncbi:hypothetical protein [Chromobacterium paludis]|uniref:Uncharacterized protein n=1 Tax=Chromobacterium paludis TaxID=2605945 RepID=A0A5C1DIF1_9NEIS|nr:hypothetical protein [Chromobacterium paludis]QEL55468.1 hypothetical protein FYK34_07775 [Chromobacterium paludis]